MRLWPGDWPPFLWGSATSSHQIEGHQTNDWTQWENRGHGIDKSGRATDHWHRWAEDLALFHSLGLNSYRFSLEWSRIEPQPGQFDDQALGQYQAMIRRMRRLHLIPLMTLHHFTLPQWVAERGGFLHPESTTWFQRYTNVVMDALGDDVDLYITLNEPLVLVVMGYLIAIWPPGAHGFGRALKLINRLVDVHLVAYHAIKAKKPSAWVGLAHHMIAFQPWADSGLDMAMTGFVRYLMNNRFIRMTEPYQDFIGVNYYTRQYIRFFKGLHPIQSRPGTPLSDLGWEIYPKGLLDVLHDVAHYQKPILVTENGIATKDDSVRTAFLQDHLHMVSQAQQAGLDVRGYYYWSALDNFEWAEGYSPRFGLIDVNYETLERQIRPSGQRYHEIISANQDAFPIIVPSV